MEPNPDDTVVEDLLDHWEEAYAQGREIPVDQLCRDYPDLSGEVARQIELLKRSNWMLRTMVPEGELDDALADEAPDLPGYDILGTLGRGGMGVVYKAREARLKRLVALKMIRARRSDSQESRHRFISEAETVACLNHPNIVQIYAMEEDSEGRPFYSMRLIEGHTMADAIADYHDQPSSLKFRDLLQRFVTVCQTVAFAHSRSIIHRDLKPSNIMLGDFQETLVVDWGVAKNLSRQSAERPSRTSGKATSTAVHDQDTRDDAQAATSPVGLTEAGQTLGTLAFMSPEQANGRKVGPATDVYALGAILYTLLTGQPPQRAKAAAQVFAPAFENMIPPSTLVGGVPRPLESICRKAMSREPERRYATAATLANDIECWLGDEPVSTYRDPWVVRLRRFARRHRTLATAAAVLLITTTVGLAVGVVAVNEQKRQTEVALVAEAKRRQQAREALDALSSRIVDQWLMKQRDLTDEHREFLRETLASYEAFAAETIEDEESRAGVAAAYTRVGNIHKALGNSAEALSAYNRAKTLHLALKNDFPNQPEYRVMLAENYAALGRLHARAGRRDEADTAYRRALDIGGNLLEEQRDSAKHQAFLAGVHHSVGRLQSDRWEDQEAADSLSQAIRIYRVLRNRDPASADVRHDLARVLLDFATTQKYLKQNDEAVKAFSEGIQLEEGLVAEYPRVTGHRWMLAVLLNDLGVLYKSQGHYKKAEPLYQRALELRKVLAAELPSHPEYGLQLSGSYLNLGNLVRIAGRPTDAIGWYEQGIPLLQNLLKRDANYVLARRFIRNTYEGKAEAHILLQQFPEALTCWEQSNSHNAPEYKLNDLQFDVRLPLRRAFVNARMGDEQTALKTIDTTLKSADSRVIPEAHYHAAAALAALASRHERSSPDHEQYATEAVELLGTALGQDFDSSGPKGKHWTDDPDFEVLSERPDYQDLVIEFSE